MFKTELKKALYQKKLYAIVSISMVIFIAFFFLNDTSNHLVEQKSLLYRSFKDEVYDEIEKLDQNKEISNEEKESIKNDYLVQYETILELIMAAETSNWQRELESLNRLDEENMTGSNYVYYTHLIEDELQDETPFTRVEFRNYLMKHDIKPNSNQTKETATHFLLKVYEDLLPMILPILITCLSILCVHEEFSQKTYKFMFQMPYSRIRIISSKLILSMLAAFLLLSILLTISFFLPYSLNGIGYLNYPINASPNLPFTFTIGDNSYIKAGHLLCMLVLILPITTAFYSIYSCFIFILNSTPSSMVAALLIPFSFTAFSKLFSSFVFDVLPFTDVCHYKAFTANNFISPFLSIGILIISSLLLMISLFLTVKRKNFY